MLYVCIAMTLHFLYNIYKSWWMDKNKIYKVFIEEPEKKEEEVPEEEPQMDPVEQRERLKLGNIFEYQKGSKRNKQKRVRGQQKADQEEDFVV